MTDGQKFWSRRQIVVPKVVMDRLEMPEPLSGFRVERDKAVAVKIVARTIAAVKIESRGSQRNVSDAAIFVHGHFAPVVNSARGSIEAVWQVSYPTSPGSGTVWKT